MVASITVITILNTLAIVYLFVQTKKTPPKPSHALIPEESYLMVGQSLLKSQ